MKNTLENNPKFKQIDKNIYLYNQLFQAMTSPFKIVVKEINEAVEIGVIPEQLGFNSSKKLNISKDDEKYYKKLVNETYCPIRKLSGNIDIERAILKTNLTSQSLKLLTEYTI